MANKYNTIGLLAFQKPYSGGVFQYMHSLIDALSLDDEFTYIIFTDSDGNQFDSYNLEVRKITKPTAGLFKRATRLAQLLFNIQTPFFFTGYEIDCFKDIDLFISPVISPYPHLFLNKPFVVSLHDLQERYYPEYFAWRERMLRHIENATLPKYSTHIICESNYVKADIEKYLKQNRDKISVIPSPPPSSLTDYEFNDDKFSETKLKYNLPNRYIFYPAQFWYHKNHIKLLEAFRLVANCYSDLHLVLTGEKSNNYTNVFNKVAELNLDNRVVHLGYIDYKDMPYLYKMSEMLVMPTLFESISIPIYEAFSLKVAVCASNVVALPEQIGDAGLMFDPNDIDDMSQRIMQLLRDKKMRDKFIDNGYKKITALDHYAYKNRLIQCLKSL